MSDLVLPMNWTRFSDDELRNFIKITESAYKSSENSQIAGIHSGYFRRLYRARLLVLYRELDRRIARQNESFSWR